jgi:hypothetical protein
MQISVFDIKLFAAGTAQPQTYGRSARKKSPERPSPPAPNTPQAAGSRVIYKNVDNTAVAGKTRVPAAVSPGNRNPAGSPQHAHICRRPAVRAGSKTKKTFHTNVRLSAANTRRPAHNTRILFYNGPVEYILHEYGRTSAAGGTGTRPRSCAQRFTTAIIRRTPR